MLSFNAFCPPVRVAFFILITLAAGRVDALAQPSNPAARWEKQIAKFEQADEQNPPPSGGVLFVGSSSIRMWDTKRWFPDEAVINRGFGGSEIADLNYFAQRIVIPYRPALILLYAGDNDVARGKSAEQVLADFRTFAELVQSELPGTRVSYISVKPSLARWNLWPTMQDANERISQYIETQPRLHFTDIAAPMLGVDGTPQADLFARDGLHLNDAGYELWTSIVAQTMAEMRAKEIVKAPSCSPAVTRRYVARQSSGRCWQRVRRINRMRCGR